MVGKVENREKKDPIILKWVHTRAVAKTKTSHFSYRCNDSPPSFYNQGGFLRTNFVSAVQKRTFGLLCCLSCYFYLLSRCFHHYLQPFISLTVCKLFPSARLFSFSFTRAFYPLQCLHGSCRLHFVLLFPLYACLENCCVLRAFMAQNIFGAAGSAFILPSTHSERNLTFQDNYLPERVKDGEN